MTISITDRSDLLTPILRDLAERRLLFALSRFDSRVEHVDMVVEDENGPRGGVDKSCRVTVGLRRSADIVISDKDSDISKCISRVAERLGRAVSRAIARTQRFERERPAFIENI